MFHVLVEEVISQMRNLVFPLAQWWNLHGHDIEPVEQIFTKFPGANSLSQVAVSRRHHSDIHFDRLSASQPLKLPILQDLEELGLETSIHVADFVKQNRTALGLFKFAGGVA